MRARLEEIFEFVTMTLSALFFLSGFAALLFESLWFRQAHLAFGSSVWASSLVLSSFMAGIALGSAAAARIGSRLRRPVVTYALLELVVGVLGMALVVLLPNLGLLMVPLFRPVLETGPILHALRFALSFILLLGPAAAMGATLPILVRALTQRGQDFGGALGMLYGWNTFGAVFGALAGELFFLSHLGVTGTGVVAAGVNGTAAIGALVFVRRQHIHSGASPRPSVPARNSPTTLDPSRISARSSRLLLAAFLAGALLLALEVVWFRLLMLFVLASSRAFAVLLAVVLAGIAAGSLGATIWMRRDPGAERWAGAIALTAGAMGIAGYALLGIPLAGAAQHEVLSPTGLALCLTLMFPVSTASGLLFNLLGKALNDSLHLPVRSAGMLVLVNTVGAAIGPIVAGFALLPWIGVEASIFWLCVSYLGVALLSGFEILRPARTGVIAAFAFAAALLMFPFGRMEESYLTTANKALLWPGAEVIAVREGLTETIQYSRTSFLGEPVGFQLITNGHSMASSGFISRRYMSLFVHLPVALHPAPRDALLISFGVGNTARSLTRVAGLRSIDVVDISRDILEMSSVAFPDSTQNPLRDPRVTVHIEDGRYFLQTTSKRFDLITGEPPPPRLGNVRYLYTQEFFQLAYDRLRAGGLISYWLPVDQLTPSEAGSITAAFCAVFEDCSVWNAGNQNWTLIGSRGGIDPLDASTLRRQWLDPQAAADLRAIGVESPEALGALFIADAKQLQEIADLGPALVDDYPLRIHNRQMPIDHGYFLRFQDSRRTRQRFADSAWVRRIWPKDLRRATLTQFRLTGLYQSINGISATSDPAIRLEMLRSALETSDLEILPLFALELDPRRVEIAENLRDENPSSATVELHLAGAALSRREWSQAAARYRAAESAGAPSAAMHLAIYAHCRAGEAANADALRQEVFDTSKTPNVSDALRREPGIDGCWAAAWDSRWQRK